MLIIKSLEYKNFLSTGNSPVKIKFDKTTSLIVGTNGSGKSTMISALIFGLYGRDFRGINKGGLVNSINKKKLEVILEFSIQNKEYKIKRGIKPDIFEIYENDNLLEMKAAKKDQQEYFEINILKFPYAAFKQIVTIGSGEYIQFMRLSAAQRRSFIENILPDVSILNVMSDLLKKDLSEEKEKEIQIKNEIQFLSGKLTSLYKSIELQKQESEIELKELKKTILSKKEEIQKIDDTVTNITETIASKRSQTDKYDTFKSALSKLNSAIYAVEKDILTNGKSLQFISDLTDCPTCYQSVSESHKSSIRLNYKSKITEDESKLTDLKSKLSKVENSVIQFEDILNEISKLEIELNTNLTSRKYLISEIDKYKQKIQSIPEKSTELNIELENSELKMKEYNQVSIDIKRKIDLYQTKLILLKDTGIKSKVISSYLDMINKSVNKYLDMFEFNVEFYLDDTFNESLKSRYRDEFKYNNFSEGEKSRIDLSLLFTWREIAKLNNNLNCNLLIFDEILDGSLDANGIADLKIIFDKYSDSNIIVISHRDDVSEQFENILRFEKISNFTTMSYE